MYTFKIKRESLKTARFTSVAERIGGGALTVLGPIIETTYRTAKIGFIYVLNLGNLGMSYHNLESCNLLNLCCIYLFIYAGTCIYL